MRFIHTATMISAREKHIDFTMLEATIRRRDMTLDIYKSLLRCLPKGKGKNASRHACHSGQLSHSARHVPLRATTAITLKCMPRVELDSYLSRWIIRPDDSFWINCRTA